MIPSHLPSCTRRRPCRTESEVAILPSKTPDQHKRAVSQVRLKRSPLQVTAIAAALVLLFVGTSPGLALAQLTVLESGFSVTTLPQGIGAKGIECSPGGMWGDYVYVADSSAGVIERIDFSNNVTLFASGLNFPVGMDFGPGPGGNFGNFLYVANFGGSTVVKVDSSGTVSAFATMTSPADVKFDSSGAYGNDLHATTAFGAPINTLDNAGTPSLFSNFASAYLRFAPGGAWGTGLYATDQNALGLAKVDSLGVATPFASGFTAPEGFDWAFGAGFGGDMFLADLGGNVIYRIKSNGTKTVFANMNGAADVAYCNGALYAVSFSGGCFKIIDNAEVPALSGPGQFVLLLSLIAGATAAVGVSRRNAA